MRESPLWLPLAALAALTAAVPLPNPRQLEFMDLELAQFMHFGIPTFWDPPDDFLYTGNPTSRRRVRVEPRRRAPARRTGAGCRVAAM